MTVMKVAVRPGLLVAALSCALSCAGGEADLIDGVFTDEEWAKIQELSPLPDPPTDPTNRYQHDPAAAKLGQKFFFESDFAGPLTVGDDGQNGALGNAGDTGKVSCAACHHGPWLIDTRSNPNNASLGGDWLPRNAATMVNTAYYSPWIENDGLLDSLWSEGMIDIEADISFNSSRLALAHLIYDKYRDEYNAAFDPDLDPALDAAHPDAARFPASGRPSDPEWQAMTPADQDHVTGIYVNFGKSIHAYLTLLTSKDAPFDRYVAGEKSAISASAKRGLKLFVGKAACAECHATPHFSDDDFHNNGLAIEGPHINPDETGRAATVSFVLNHEFNSKSKWSDDPSDTRLDGLVEDDALIGRWRTKGLRQIAETAPYMHSGQFKTLEEVIDFYNDGGAMSGYKGVKDDILKPLNLTEGEKSDLVEFLKTLTGAPVADDLLRDIR